MNVKVELPDNYLSGAVLILLDQLKAGGKIQHYDLVRTSSDEEPRVTTRPDPYSGAELVAVSMIMKCCRLEKL